MSALRKTVAVEIRAINVRLAALLKMLESGDDAKQLGDSPSSANSEPFTGLPIESKYRGQCCVCGDSYNVGAAIIYDPLSKKAGHLGCGRASKRGVR